MDSRVRQLLWPALLLVLLGCGQESKLGRVHGVVRLDGNPLSSGTVRFVPEAGRAAEGQIQSDGSFTLGTYGSSDGALIGPHKVAIIAYEASGDGRPAYAMRGQSSKALVPQRYMSTGTSGLTFDVKPGENQAEFDLKSKL
jgi:hypothetical protein